MMIPNIHAIHFLHAKNLYNI